MSTAHDGDLGHSPLRGYLAVLRRRWWYIALALVLAPAAAVAYSLTQPDRYEATAKVLLSRQDFAGALSGITSPEVYQDPNRIAQTQLEIARVPEIAQRVIRQNGLQGDTAESFLDDSRVVAAANADILEFSVTAAVPELARTLATAYGVEFTRYRSEVESAALTRAERGVERRLGQLRASGDRDSRLYESLLERREQLRTLGALGTQNAVLLRAADEAARVQPRPVRNAVLAGLLGLLLGVSAAGVAEALDTRTRWSGEVSEALQLPLLGRIPESTFKRNKRTPLAILRAPSGPEAEAFRTVRANLDVLLRNTDRRTIMVTSALGVEGKSTTLSNLAVALRSGGRHVIAVDLDLRQPSLSRLFGVPASPGVTDVRKRCGKPRGRTHPSAAPRPGRAERWSRSDRGARGLACRGAGVGSWRARRQRPHRATPRPAAATSGPGARRHTSDAPGRRRRGAEQGGRRGVARRAWERRQA